MSIFNRPESHRSEGSLTSIAASRSASVSSRLSHKSTKRSGATHLQEKEKSNKRLRLSPLDGTKANQRDARHFRSRNHSDSSLEEWLATCSPKPAKAVGIHISLQSSSEWVDYSPNTVNSTPREEILTRKISEAPSHRTDRSSLKPSQSSRSSPINRPKGSSQKSPIIDLTEDSDEMSLRGASPELGSVRMPERRYQGNSHDSALQARENEAILRHPRDPNNHQVDVTAGEGANTTNTNDKLSTILTISTPYSSHSSISPPPLSSAIRESSFAKKVNFKSSSNSKTFDQHGMNDARDLITSPKVSHSSNQPNTPRLGGKVQTPPSNRTQQSIDRFLEKSPRTESTRVPVASMGPSLNKLNLDIAQSSMAILSTPFAVSPTKRTARKKLPASRSSAAPTSPSLADSSSDSSKEDYTAFRVPRELRKRNNVQSKAQKNNSKWQQQHQDHPFMAQLKSYQRYQVVSIVNEEDLDPPPNNFKFISKNIFLENAEQPDPGANYGCSCDSNCDANSCSCVAEQLHPDDRDENKGSMPYTAGKLLTKKYQTSKVVIHECNSACSCPPTCRNRNVGLPQEMVSLEIFKTKDRGWALRSRDAIPRGQLLDTYRGEILTEAEATVRIEERLGKDVYLFDLDRFASDLPEGEKPYVIDAEFAGSPSRFINHSCDPNVGVYGVSLFRGNPRVYELAFFTLMDILPGEELVFDYKGMDRDDENSGAEEEGAQDCLCGASGCRRRFL